MNKKVRQTIADRLVQRIGEIECPMCHKGPFTLIDRYVHIELQEDLKTYVMGAGPSLISAVIICNNCGYTSLHNLIALGVGDSSPEQKKIE